MVSIINNLKNNLLRVLFRVMVLFLFFLHTSLSPVFSQETTQELFTSEHSQSVHSQSASSKNKSSQGDHLQSASTKNKKHCEKKYCEMIVFIHGTMSGRFHVKRVTNWLAGSWLSRLLKEDFFKNIEKTIERKDVYAWQPLSDLGFWPIDTDKEISFEKKEFIGQQTAILYEQVYKDAYPDTNNVLKFHTYTWNGALRASERFLAAYDLYPALLARKKELERQTGLPVKITLLGHSHGCNVILRLALLEESWKEGLFVDKIVLFGGPVHRGTERLIASDMFGKKYVVYSQGDSIQVLDFVSVIGGFARRTFGSEKKHPIDLPDNLWQMEVLVGDHKPSHMALWLWGLGGIISTFFYGKKNPLYPLPLMIYAPRIFALADQVDTNKIADRSCLLRFDESTQKLSLSTEQEAVCCSVDTDQVRQKARGLFTAAA